MLRRTFLGGCLGSMVAWVPSGRIYAATLAELLQNWREFLSADASVSDASDPLTHTEEDWKKLLEPGQYRVLREEDTERPFSSPLNDEHRPGVYVCVACDLPLFSSAMKFDSGTGWPSFFTAIPGAFGTKQDFYLIFPRTEYHCARCGGHHGHVFDDGPQPTHQRWCNNGVALRFISQAGAA